MFYFINIFIVFRFFDFNFFIPKKFTLRMTFREGNCYIVMRKCCGCQYVREEGGWFCYEGKRDFLEKDLEILRSPSDTFLQERETILIHVEEEKNEILRLQFFCSKKISLRMTLLGLLLPCRDMRLFREVCKMTEYGESLYYSESMLYLSS